MRVLVTGGTGFLGRSIVQALVARGHDPIVFARAARAARLPGRAIDGDIRDRAAVLAGARDADAICHAAATVKVWDPDPRVFDRVNVGGLEHVLAAASTAGIGRIVYTSSFLARPPRGEDAPLRANDYQRTKVDALAVAARAQAQGAPIVIVYPGVIYGHGVMSEGNLVGRWLAEHAAGRFPGLIGADRMWSYAWVDDVARAHVAALEHPAPAPAYDLGGENTAQIRPFEIAVAVRGGRLPRRIPFWVARGVAAVEETRARVTGRPPLLTRGTVEIFTHDWPVGHADAVRDLGFSVMPLEEGIRKLLE